MRKLIAATFVALCSFAGCTGNSTLLQLQQQVNELQSQLSAYQLKKGYIQHTVQFNLKWDEGSPEAVKFLQDGQRILSALPMVHNFAALHQVGTKNDYKYYFTMVFDSREAYEAYNNHPNHVKFVSERWETEVTNFLEADFVTQE